MNNSYALLNEEHCAYKQQHSFKRSFISFKAHHLFYSSRVGQSHIYIRCIYGIFGRDIIKYT